MSKSSDSNDRKSEENMRVFREWSNSIKNEEIRELSKDSQKEVLSGDLNSTLDPDSEWTWPHIQKNTTYLDLQEKDFNDWLANQRVPDQRKIKARYERLELYNRGTHRIVYNRFGCDYKETYKPIMRRMDNWYLCATLSSRFEMGQSERKAIWEMFARIDKRRYKSYGMDKNPLIIFCISILFHNQSQDKNKWKYYPGKEFREELKFDGRHQRITDLVERHEIFQTFAEEYGLKEVEIRSCLEKVRSEDVMQQYINPGALYKVMSITISEGLRKEHPRIDRGMD